MTKHNTYTRTDKIVTKITTWIAAIAAILLFSWGVVTIFRFSRFEETDDAQVEAYINPITSRVSGFITEIRYEENQDVKKGDTLIVIDNREYVLQQNQSSAALKKDQQQISVLKSAVKTFSEISLVEKAKISSVKARLVKEKQQYERYKKLYAAESATKQQLEAVESALAVAEADYQSALSSYQASLSKIEDSKSQLAPLNSEIAARQNVVKLHELNNSYTIITAPYDGKMGKRTIQQGQQIQIGQTLAYIVDMETGLWIVANFKETQIKNMEIGQDVEVITDAYPDKKLKGKILSLSPATGSRFSLLPPDNSTGNFVKIAQRIPVKIIIDKGQESSFLSPGMNADVTARKKS